MTITIHIGLIIAAALIPAVLVFFGTMAKVALEQKKVKRTEEEVRQQGTIILELENELKQANDELNAYRAAVIPITDKVKAAK